MMKYTRNIRTLFDYSEFNDCLNIGKDAKFGYTPSMSVPFNIEGLSSGDWITLIYVEKGNLTLTYKYGEFQINNEKTIVIGSNAQYSVKWHDSQTQCRYLFINRQYMMDLVEHDPLINQVYEIQSTLKLSILINKIIENMHYKTPSQLLLYNAHLLYLIHYLIENNRIVYLGKVKKKPELLDDILAYLDNNFTNQISLQGVADEFGITPQYVSRLFRERIGFTFKVFIDRLRIDKARYLIVSTDQKIYDISYECGYMSQKSFIRAFKSVVNESPQSYRQKYKKHY